VSFAAITLCVVSKRVFGVRVKCDPRFSVISEMADSKEQRICVKFCFELGKTASETHRMLKTAFGDNAMGRTQTFEWFSRFKHGETSVEDCDRLGRPSTGRTDENVENVRKIVYEDRRNTITEIADRLGLSSGTCQRILTEDLNMRRISAKLVPRLLTEEEKQRRVLVCQELLDEVRNDQNFLSRVITGDETWVYCYDPETKQQPSQWKSSSSPRPKKARQVRSNIKSMLVIFFDCEGIVHQEFVPPGQTVNQHYYLEVLKRLREQVRRKRPERWRNQDWLLHHENAPAHSALSVQRFLAAENMTVVPHPPYSPDLAPCDFFLFPRMKSKLKGRRFQDVTEIQEQSLTVLHAIPKSQFQRCFQQWQTRWTRCINSEGEYFEGEEESDE
jgi:hypothetical protein